MPSFCTGRSTGRVQPPPEPLPPTPPPEGEGRTMLRAYPGVPSRPTAPGLHPRLRSVSPFGASPLQSYHGAPPQKPILD